MFDHGLIEGLDTDESGPESRDLARRLFHDVLCQVCRKASQGKEGEPAFAVYGLGKIGIVADIGHGTLHDGVAGAEFLGEGGVLFQGVMGVHQGGELSHTGEEAGDDRGHIRGLLHESFGEYTILADEKEALDRIDPFGVDRGKSFFDLTAQDLGLIGLVEKGTLHLAKLFDHLGGQLVEEADAVGKGAADGDGVKLLDFFELLAKGRCQGGFIG